MLEVNIYEIDDFTSEEDLISWGLANFWDVVGEVDPEERFSRQMLVFQGVRSLRKAARRYTGEELPFHAWWDVVLRDDLEKAARDGRYQTAAEDALALIEQARGGVR